MPGTYGKGGLSCAEEVLLEHDLHTVQVDAEAQVVVGLPLPTRERAAMILEDPTLQRLRLACTVVLVTVVLCFGLAMQAGSEVEWMWSLSVTGIGEQQHQQRATVGAGTVWPEEQRPSVVRADGLDDDDAGGQHRRWDKRGAFAATDDDSDGDHSEWRWRRQHARTAYLRTLL
jgi:hypothetical protein